MMTQLPKLFGRNFAIGFFIPSAVIGAALWGIVVEYGYQDVIRKVLQTDLLIGATLIVSCVWFGAIFLMAMNRPLLRILEGYGEYHPLKWRECKMRRKFEELVIDTTKRQGELDIARARCLHEPLLPVDHAKKLRTAVEDFPDKLDDVLPTRFGNKMRAFEVYSRVVYGIDAIPVWPRLQALLPAQFRNTIDEAKAYLDFSVNILCGSAVCIFFYAAISVAKSQVLALWIPIICLIVAFFSYRLSLGAALEWGQYVKSAFDLYRGKLAKQLGLQLPRSSDAERTMWNTVSRMMIYRSSARGDELVKYRPLPK